MAEAATDDQHQAPERSNQELAAQLFGRNYHGAVPEPAAEPTPEPEVPEIASEEPVEALSGEEEATADETPPEEPEAEEETVRSFSELVETEGYDPEFMESLTHSIKVNGEVRELPYTELRAAAQKHYAAEDAFEQAKTLRKEALAEARTQRERFDNSIQVVSAVAKRSLEAVQAEMQKLESSSLRADDPAEYSAQKLALQEKLDAEKASILTIAKAVEDENARRAQQIAQEQQQELARGAEQLLKAIPAWSDPEVAKRETEAVMAYVTGTGLFTEQQVRENTIPGLWVLAHKARLYDESQGAADVTKKRLKRVPKVATPGAPKAPEQVNAEQAARAREGIRQATGTTAQIQAAVRARQLSRRK